MNRNHRQNQKHRQRGATILEFALGFLVFFSVVYAVMEFGRIIASYNILAGATREATRYATVHGSFSGSPASSSDIQDVARKWAIGLDTSSLVVTTSWSPSNAPGSTVKVQSSYTAVPFSAFIFKNGVTLTSSSQMVISQ